MGGVSGVPAWVVWVVRQRGWCASVAGAGGILKSVVLVILNEIPGCCARQNHAWRNISQTLS